MLRPYNASKGCERSYNLDQSISDMVVEGWRISFAIDTSKKMIAENIHLLATVGTNCRLLDVLAELLKQ